MPDKRADDQYSEFVAFALRLVDDEVVADVDAPVCKDPFQSRLSSPGETVHQEDQCPPATVQIALDPVELGWRERGLRAGDDQHLAVGGNVIGLQRETLTPTVLFQEQAGRVVL